MKKPSTKENLIQRAVRTALERQAAKKKAAAAKVDEKAKVEEPKKVEEEKPKPEVKKKVEQKPKTEEVKQEAKKTDTQKTQKPKKEEKVPLIIPENADDKKLSGKTKALDRAAALVGGVTGIPMGSVSSSLDGKAMLSYVMWGKYGKNEELQKNYPELYSDLMRSIDVVTMLALVDIRQDLINRNEKGELSLTVNVNQILPLQNMAGLLGIKLAEPKALPGNDTQMSIDFKNSEIPEELTKKEPVVETVPDLATNKVKTDDELKDVLQYLITKEHNVANNLVNTVEWYRIYCMSNESDSNKKLKLDDQPVSYWINEIFKRIQPTALINGLGGALYNYTALTGSPCMAHSILHNHMSKLGWTEDQIADTLKTLVVERFKNIQQGAKEKVDPKDNRAIQAITGLLGNDYINKIMSDSALDIESITDEKEKSTKNYDYINARRILGAIRTNYFTKDEKKVESQDDLRLKLGQIINLYRDPADRLAEYCQNEIVTKKVGEYPTDAK